MKVRNQKFIGIYVRVSSRQQSTRSQLPDLQRWAAAQDATVKWYEDKATGRVMHRPAWDKLEEDVRLGKVSSVVVWRVDRCGRTAAGLTRLFDELQQRKVNFISIKDNIDLSTVTGRLVANIMASLAQWETELRGERVRAGMDAARKAAEKSGKPLKRGGSKKGSHYKVNRTQLKLIHQMKADGEAISRIAQAMCLSRPTIYKVLAQHSD